MIIGQTVFGFTGTYYSPWFPRQGDAAVFAAEVIANGVSGSLMFQIESKNREQTDAAGSVVGSSVLFSSGIGTFSGSGLLELVRFGYRINPAGTGWVHFRVLPPAWRMNGA